jgi:ATP-dependent 26S proteasome regulatory subunit
LIRGTTGSGKSVLARRIAQATPNGNGRTLKISDSVLKYCTLDKVSSLVKYLSPSVILIDDFGVREDLTLEDLLALLELVRPPDSLLILTMMTGSEPSRRLSPGSRYLTGMRPGRIDEIVDIYLPDLPLRRKILKYYFDSSSFRISEGTLDSIARATKGLSGAYLAEVARRISARGVSQWHGEVTQVLSMAPKPGGRT